MAKTNSPIQIGTHTLRNRITFAPTVKFDFAAAVIEGKAYTKCLGCKACQYGPFTAHKCPAEMIRQRA